MKTKIHILISLLILFYFVCSSACAQQVNGKMVQQKDNITVIKVWGNHQERGFAYGYLGGEKILNLFKKYITAAMGKNLAKARATINNKKYFHIEDKYIEEAKAIIQGMKAAKVELQRFDYIDLLVANSFLDIRRLVKNGNLSNGCSSLISWGSATKNTDLNGGSVITRHLDWTVVPALIENNLILVHIPSEKDEQPWLMVGYFGQMNVLSGCNKAGLSVFQHVMYDNISKVKFREIRAHLVLFKEAIEQKDYDKSGSSDVNDLKAVLKSNKYGYADAFIITALANSHSKPDSLIALVAEIAPDKPYFTFRNNSFPDKIPGDNLYAANYPIKRKNQFRYGRRYKSVQNALSEGFDIDATKSWELLTTYSRIKGNNLQTMQVVPGKGILKLSVWQNNKEAFKNKPQVFDLNELFKK